MNDLTVTGNLIESVLWIAIALVMAVKSARAKAPFRSLFTWLAAAFLIFGISDIIESRTGAWWRPPWLFIMKAACVAVFLFGFRRYYKLGKNARTDE